MNFKNWLNIKETGTSAGAVSGGGGGTSTADVANVPTRLFGRPVSRRFAKSIATNGLGGEVEIEKLNAK